MQTDKWFRYRQNNSGGKHRNDPFALIVKATDHKQANEKAKEHIYFNGCEDGTDCSCCGDRWYEKYDSDIDGYEVFTTKEEAVSEARECAEGWIKDPEIRVIE